MTISYEDRTYLGDGVYASFDGYQVCLIVEAGASESGREQRIYLEPAVLDALGRFCQARGQKVMRHG